jgi:hypothetical protein
MIFFLSFLLNKVVAAPLHMQTLEKNTAITSREAHTTIAENLGYF